METRVAIALVYPPNYMCTVTQIEARVAIALVNPPN